MQYIGPHQHFTPAACEDPYAQDRQHSPQRSAYKWLNREYVSPTVLGFRTSGKTVVPSRKDYYPVGANHGTTATRDDSRPVRTI